jgi:Arc-like DNA binding domain
LCASRAARACRAALAERHHRSVHGELLARLEDGIRLAERAERRREVADARQAQG